MRGQALNRDPGKPAVPFGRIPYAAITSGRLAELAGAELKVYVAMAGHANKDYFAHPGDALIARQMNLDLRTVERAKRILIREHLIRRVGAGGGRSRKAGYVLVTNPDELAGVSDTDNPGGAVQQPRPPHPETPAVSSRNPGDAVRMNRENRPTTDSISADRADVGDEEGRGPVATAALTDGHAVHAELARLGVTEPKRSELAAMPGLTVGIVRELAKRTGKAANPAGLLVAMLEREGPAMAAKARGAATARERMATVSEARIAADEAQAARVAREREERHQLIAGLDAGQLARYVERVLQDATPTQRRRWTAADPLKNHTLGVRVVELVKRDRAAAGKHAEAPGALAPLP